jgi:hypothetical protein
MQLIPVHDIESAMPKLCHLSPPFSLLRKSRRSFLFARGTCPDSAALAWLPNY